MDSPLTSLSTSHSIEPPTLSIPLLNDVDTIQRPPKTCVTLETTINKGGRASVKNVNFSTFSAPTIFGCCMITMDSPMLSHRDGDTCEFTSLSVALPFPDDASGSLAGIIKVGEGYGTFDKYSERFSSATIKNRSLDSYQ